MTEHSLWRFSRALHRAINERQLEDVEALIDEEVDWAIHGPIDMFPFLGARRGKAAVLEVIRNIADNFRVHRFDRESIMLGADQAASMLRYSLSVLDANKPVSLRVAHFAQFSSGTASCAVSACWSIASIWWSRRSAARSICRGSRPRPEPSFRGDAKQLCRVGKGAQHQPHRGIQAQLVSADPAAAPGPPRERSSIAAYWPRCGQNRRH